MNVVAFSGSARVDGNTALLVKTAFAELEKEGIRTRLVELAGQPVFGCRACYRCFERKDRRCAREGDRVNEWIELMLKADGIILASPTYFADASPEIMALVCRAGMTARANGAMFARKAGAAVAAVRRAGAMHAFDSLNHFFTISQMFVVGSSYWNIGIGREKGEAAGDAEGLQTMRDLGRNMAWLLKKLRA
ncbi:MAG: flavodoxin family protein [Elusimicrobia bacterium]|nr:flavodoxin family protein [Elusimicrobiota bacterium]